MALSTQTVRNLAVAVAHNGAVQELVTAINNAIALVANATGAVYTILTGKTLAVTDADKLTVGGVIVPQASTLVEQTIALSATKVIHNLFTARDAWQVTHIDYTPDVAQGSALTATVVKASGTATPASATTPLHIAAAVDLNAAAHTVQPITLSATVADLKLAAGDRIAIVLSGAMTAGSGQLTVRGKRI